MDLVKQGHSKRCRACGFAVMGLTHKTHGMSKTPVFDAWYGIRRRCYDVTHKSYPFYGGRGIYVCDRWMDEANGFHHFVEDMGPPPKGYHLDRVDNDGPYSPDNCKWKTRKENMRNRRDCLVYDINGESKCLSAWCDDDRCVVPYSCAYQRVRNGGGIEDALCTPVRRRKK